MDIEIQEVEDFRRPSRKPWLLLVVLVAIGGYLGYRHFASPRGTTGRETSKKENLGDSISERPTVQAQAAEAGQHVKRPTVGKKQDSVRLAPALPVAKDKKPAAEDGKAGGSALIRAGGSANVNAWLNEGRLLESKDDLAGAREKYLAVLASNASQAAVQEAERRLGAIHVAMAFSSRSMPEKTDYLVKKGDFLLRIAQQHGTTVDLITVSNGLKSGAMIKAGDLLRVLDAKFSIVASTTRNDLTLTMNGRFFKRYAVGTGKDEKTPLGTFVIASKEKEPVWWPQGREIPYGHPDNILGTRWMALRATGETPDIRGYGIHGTWDDRSIGKSVSAGCIRMRNKDVEELFALVTLGVPVTIAE